MEMRLLQVVHTNVVLKRREGQVTESIFDELSQTTSQSLSLYFLCCYRKHPSHFHALAGWLVVKSEETRGERGAYSHYILVMAVQ